MLIEHYSSILSMLLVSLTLSCSLFHRTVAPLFFLARGGFWSGVQTVTVVLGVEDPQGDSIGSRMVYSALSVLWLLTHSDLHTSLIRRVTAEHTL